MELVKSDRVPAHLAAKYEAEAGRYWDLFYKRNADRFFKDRHWFEAEFPQLLAARTVLEVGCGAGNTVFPLLELNRAARVFACDFAPSGVELVCAHPAYAGGRVHAFVADVTADELTAEVPAGSVDACTLLFVLSAMSPPAMRAALRRVAPTLRPGADLLFRDYATGDLAEERLGGEGRQQRLAPNFYVRWDGTRAFYFDEGFLRELFESEGFACQYVRRDERVQENRARGARWDRQFLQAAFTWRGGGAAGTPTQQQHKQQQQPPPQQQQQVEGDDEAAEEVAVAVGQGAAALRLRLLCRPRPQRGPAADEGAAGRARAEVLAEVVLRCPRWLHGRDVLELCGWDAPLASLAALRWCRRAVAAGTDEAAMRALRANARRNSHLVVIERLRLQQLGWRGEAAQHGQRCCQRPAQLPPQSDTQPGVQLLRALPAGFDAVLAAVSGSSSAAEYRSLLAAAAALLSRQPGSLALLCVDDEPEVQLCVAEAAAAAGLHEACSPAPELAAALAAVGAGHRFVALQLAS